MSTATVSPLATWRMRRRIRRLLARLGNTPRQIALTLHLADGRGSSADGEPSPIAVWLRQRGIAGTIATWEVIDVVPPGTHRGIVRVSTPPPVAEFLRLFDAPAYEREPLLSSAGLRACACLGEGCEACDGQGVIYP